MGISKNGQNVKITYFFVISSEREREFYTKDQHDKIEKNTHIIMLPTFARTKYLKRGKRGP